MKFNLISAFLPALVLSHVSVNPREGPEDSYAVTSVRIPHGCDKSPTVKVVVEFDQILIDAKTIFSAAYLPEWKTEKILVDETSTQEKKKLEKRHDDAKKEEDKKDVAKADETKKDDTKKEETKKEETKKEETKKDDAKTETAPAFVRGFVYSGGKIPADMFFDFPVSFKVPLLSTLPKGNNTILFKASQLCENNVWLNWTNPEDTKYPPAKYTILPKSADGKKPGSFGSIAVPSILALAPAFFALL